MSQEEEIKIILLGECSVGKTSIINCFMNREFQSHELSTIGVEQTRKKIEVNLNNKKKNCVLKVYDSAGQERYKSVSSSYIKTTDGILLVYDISNKDTFKNLYDWMNKIQDNKSDVPMIVVGNKNDLNKKVFETDIKELEEEFKDYTELIFMESSAKNNYNINNIFEKISEKVIENRNKFGRNRIQSFHLRKKHSKDMEKKKNCCKNNN